MDAAEAFENLANLEQDFGKAEIEILRKQNELFKPLFEKRRDILKNIRNFWVVVLEAAGDEISQYITPEDSILLEKLENIYVERYDKEDPRNVRITLTFQSNDYLEDDNLSLVKEVCVKESTTKDEEGLEKTNTSLVSKPTDIKWKTGKSLFRKNQDSPPNFFDYFRWTGEEEEDDFDGASLTIFLAEDLFPNAVKYFTEAMTEEASDEEGSVDLEEEDDDEGKDEAAEGENQEPPSKKSKN
ncbi:CENP-A histone disassembly chaperone Ccp1 [Schizosaccharomyces osmophilus]|uniref:CENP-A histone disassembly chaperone Ccp1 n=1 Tax=Schizosaccharomyces osmophilus TaxID=2545709 RepID=A0AAF0AWL4_9SCHI|nr:CENP-A histone disassembly chaperone Ccp1 [Schizosaccharomyces osmophilus]WBW73548.1 CENP-A histone disassembly chaperone Ccp1 [Schizosaccharomyces osmophilus]